MNNEKEELPILIVNEKNSPPPNITTYTKLKKINKSSQKKKDIKKIILIVLLIINILIFLVMGIKTYKWYKDNKEIEQELKDINKLIKNKNTKSSEGQINSNKESNNKIQDDYFDLRKESINNIDFSKILSMNNDTKGWIEVNGTDINYPFVQTDNNDYYLTHSFSKKENSAGWIFIDYRNDINNLSKNTIIYGHGRLNNTMFGSLKKIVKNPWLSNKDNFYVKTATSTDTSLWQVFSTYTIEPESYYITTKFNDSEYSEFIKKIKNRSVYNFNVELNNNDKILTLSSCYDNSKRVVLHSKLIQTITK